MLYKLYYGCYSENSRFPDFANNVLINGKFHEINSEFQPMIHCYSLEAWQRKCFYTLLSLGTLAAALSATSLLGAHFLSSRTALLLLSGGTLLAISASVAAALYHSNFTRKVKEYLETEKPEAWNKAQDYPDRYDDIEPNPFEWQEYFGLRRSGCFYCAYFNYHIEFHRTQSIHIERMNA